MYLNKKKQTKNSLLSIPTSFYIPCTELSSRRTCKWRKWRKNEYSTEHWVVLEEWPKQGWRNAGKSPVSQKCAGNNHKAWLPAGGALPVPAGYSCAPQKQRDADEHWNASAEVEEQRLQRVDLQRRHLQTAPADLYRDHGRTPNQGVEHPSSESPEPWAGSTQKEAQPCNSGLVLLERGHCLWGRCT